MSDEAQVVNVEGAETYETPMNEEFAVLARGDEPGGDYDLLDFTVPTEPGAVPPHVHHDADEAFYVLEGELNLQVGDDEYRLTEGSYAFGPRGVPHTYRNTGDKPVRMLILFTPGTFVRMSEELADLGPVDPEDESDLERVVPILESYSVEMVGPPPEEE